MEVFILLGLVVLNGVFAMSEIAVVTARKPRLQARIAKGDRGARVALKLAENPTSFLSTVQIGITSIGLLNGIYGESVLAAPLAQFLAAQGLSAEWASVTSTALVVLVVTYISIVVGELVPKRWAQIHAESIACLVARPMRWLAKLTRPFVWLLSISTATLMRLLRVREEDQPGVTHDEINAVLSEGSQSGLIDAREHQMVRNVLRLDQRRLGSIMTPRSELVFLDTRQPPRANLQRMLDSEHSRFPVCDGGLDKLIGIIDAKQVLRTVASGKALAFEPNLDNCAFLLETLSVYELLEQFRSRHLEAVFVVDEYGEIEGLITPDDLLQAVTGDLQPRNLADVGAVSQQDGAWLLNGALGLPEVMDRLGLESLPGGSDAGYNTLSGMIMSLLDHMPSLGDVVEVDGWRLEIVAMEGRRILRVQATVLPVTPADTGEEDDG